MWKIAFIDDDRAVLQGMKKIIPWEELEAEQAGEAMNGQQGLQLIRSMQPHIVITDIYMPLMNGLDMVEELRKTGYGGKIIILSGYSDFEYARQALRLNVDDYLSKPVTKHTIKSVLEKVIGQLEDATVQKLKQHELKEKLLSYEPFVEQEWIKSVVTGNYNTSKVYPAFSQTSPYRTASSFLVLALQMVRTVRVTDVSPGDFNLFRFAVGNIVQEVVAAEWKGARFIELHSLQMAVLLYLDEKDQLESATSRIRQLADSLIRHVGRYLQVLMEIGIGSWKFRWQDIADSSEEAFQALTVKRHVPFQGLPLYEYKRDCDTLDASSKGLKQTELRPVQFYQQLGEAIRHLQEQQIMEVIDRFFNPLEEIEGVTVKDVHSLGVETWAILSYTLHDVGLSVDKLFDPEQIREELERLEAYHELRLWLHIKAAIFCRLSRKNENLKHKQAVDFMIEYIHKHYAEDLHLSDLAEKVYISRNYLSNIFRLATGETFNNYVTRVRMEKAKSLILEGRLLIYEVAEQVGYKNVPYFTTLFKKCTGSNPTEYVKN
jgi:two-component system response regulator YesN